MKRFFAILTTFSILILSGCGRVENAKPVEPGAVTVEQSEISEESVNTEESEQPEENEPAGESELTEERLFTAHFATLEEGQQLMRDRTLFHEQISDDTLDFFLQKKGGTLEDYIEYSAQQVMEFTTEEKKRVDDTLVWLQDQLESHDLKLPDIGEITIVKTTGMEALGSAGYTSEGNIFLGWFTFTSEYYSEDMFHELFTHELFHCLSRQNKDFRQEMYSIINFTLLDEDIDVPDEIRRQIIANPDVEHHNSYATFTIDGEKKDCYLVFLTDSVFENEGDTFFEGMYSGIVPLDGSKIYRIEDVEDFWDVVGRNTDYAEDPEEIMATDFASAILHIDDGYKDFNDPEILEKIIECLRD